MAHGILQGCICLPANPADDTVKEAFVVRMKKGNELYESKGCNSLLFFDEVQEMFTEKIRVVLVRDIISGRVDRWQVIVDSLCKTEAGVLVKTPISVCLCGSGSSLALFEPFPWQKGTTNLCHEPGTCTALLSSLFF